MRKSDEIRQKLATLKNEATSLLNREGVTAEELRAKQAEIEAQEAALEIALKMEKEAQNAQTGKQHESGLDNSQAAYTKAFYNVLKGKATIEDQIIIKNALSSTVEADGGLLIPVDQQTEINELKRQIGSLRELVTVEPVGTKSGSRVIEKHAETTPFAVLNEKGTIADTDSPQFEAITYDIKDYAGILPIPNNLLNDTDTKIRAYLNRWLAKKSVATENGNIITVLKTGTKKDVKALDDVKDILNTVLDPAISKNAVVVMNQDSFNLFDKMKDTDGKYILQPDPLNPTRKLLLGKTVYVYSNKILKTELQKAPVIIGDLKEAIVLFDREQMALASTVEGAGAFESNLTKIRAILRHDVKKFDGEAFVFGEISTVASDA